MIFQSGHGHSLMRWWQIFLSNTHKFLSMKLSFRRCFFCHATTVIAFEQRSFCTAATNSQPVKNFKEQQIGNEPKRPVTYKILKRIAGHGKGNWVCTPKDFLDLGSRSAVDQALHRLVKSGKLRRVGHGLYDMPYYSSFLKKFAPVNLESTIEVIARRDDIRILPDGLHAANLLRLTPAVAAKNVYQTDGCSRTIYVGGFDVELRHANPKLMRWWGRPAALVAVALFWRGPQVLASNRAVADLRRILPDYVKLDLLENKQDLPK